MSTSQLVVGLILLVRLAEFWISRRNAEARIAAGEEEIAEELHLVQALFHAIWLAALAFLTDGSRDVDPLWLGAGLLLLALRAYRLWRHPPGWTVRLFRRRSGVTGEEPMQRLLRDPSYLPLVAELLTLPLIFGLWWFALLGTAAYAVLLWRRIELER